jgi:antitoxin YefM
VIAASCAGATAYLFRSPANARRLLDAAEAAEQGKTAEHPLDRA